MSRSGPPGTVGRLGRRLATVLRGGTLIAVGTVALGLVIALVGGEQSPGPRPVIDLLSNGGGHALSSLGLLGLTILPLGVLGAAALTFHSDGEVRHLVASLVTLGLLVASLVLAGLVLRPS